MRGLLTLCRGRICCIEALADRSTDSGRRQPTMSDGILALLLFAREASVVGDMSSREFGAKSGYGVQPCSFSLIPADPPT
jgi:hypothetical protein